MPLMDKETTLLSRVAVNHLFLSQFEAFRAIIFTLRHRNPNLALSLLQTIVGNGGNFENVVYSSNCSSPALLTWLSSLELFQFDDGTSIWSSSVTPEDIKLRVEFLLYSQMVVSRVAESVKRVSEERESGEEELRVLEGSMRVLDEIMELGLRRLKEDLIVREEKEEEEEDGKGMIVKEEALVGLRRVFLENPDVFDALCENIQRQVGGDLEPDDDSGLAITLRREERVGAVSSEDDQRLLKSIQKHVQMVHLDEMKQCLEKDDIDGVISHIRYLHLDYGVAEAEYRYVSSCVASLSYLQDFVWRYCSSVLLACEIHGVKHVQYQQQ